MTQNIKTLLSKIDKFQFGEVVQSAIEFNLIKKYLENDLDFIHLLNLAKNSVEITDLIYNKILILSNKDHITYYHKYDYTIVSLVYLLLKVNKEKAVQVIFNLNNSKIFNCLLWTKKLIKNLYKDNLLSVKELIKVLYTDGVVIMDVPNSNTINKILKIVITNNGAGSEILSDDKIIASNIINFKLENDDVWSSNLFWLKMWLISIFLNKNIMNFSQIIVIQYGNWENIALEDL